MRARNGCKVPHGRREVVYIVTTDSGTKGSGGGAPCVDGHVGVVMQAQRRALPEEEDSHGEGALHARDVHVRHSACAATACSQVEWMGRAGRE